MAVTETGIRDRWARLEADPAWRARVAAKERERAAAGPPVSNSGVRFLPPGGTFPPAGFDTAAAADPLDLWPAVRDALAPAAGPVYVYGEVGWDVTAEDVVAQLAQQPGDVTVYINSPGGDVWDGLAAYGALARHGGRVTVVVDALAASIASVIAQAASPGRLLVSPASMMLVHEAWAVAGGPASDLRATADLLDKASASIAGIYAARSGKPAAGWLAAMRNETFYTSAEAVDAGLADAVTAPGAAGVDDGDGGGEWTDEQAAMIANVLRGQLMASASPDGPERGFHPDGRPVSREERRAAFAAYAAAQARRKAAGPARAFNAARPEAGASEFVRRLFGLDD